MAEQFALNGMTGRNFVDFRKEIDDTICNSELSLHSKIRSANGGESTSLKGMCVCILTQYNNLGWKPGLNSTTTICRSMRDLKRRLRLERKIWILHGEIWKMQIHLKLDSLHLMWRPTR